jgi:hypothetical protein
MEIFFANVGKLKGDVGNAIEKLNIRESKYSKKGNNE